LLDTNSDVGIGISSLRVKRERVLKEVEANHQ
jgi:hypothetical protein